MMYFDGEKNKRKKKADFKKVEEMPAPKKKPLKKGAPTKPMERPISTKAEGTMRLNRFIAHCGICSRRKADDFIVEGKVKVNNKVVKEPGTLWQTGDVVLLEGKKIEPQKFVYILLNKPKNTISTNSDEKGRKTVFDFIQDSLEAKNLGHLRLFSIGRLDRNSMGVLLLTNDGELNQELSHPSKEVEKIYQVQLDKEVKQSDIEALANGVELEDGPIHCDTIAYVHELAKDEVGVEIHSGKNRIVRRMFEHLGYTVIKLDRVSYAGLTKKNLPRGKWRFLTDNEIRRLKYFDKTKKVRASTQKKQ